MRNGILVLLIALCSGCYTVQLQPISDVPGEPLGPMALLEVPPESAAYVYDVRSFAAGIGNRWRVQVGAAFEQYGEAYLYPIFPEGDGLRLQLTVEGFDVRGFEAHIDARCAVYRGEELVLNRKYHGAGIGHFKQTAWGGAFAMKSSMRRTLDEALRDLFENMRADLKAACSELQCAEP